MKKILFATDVLIEHLRGNKAVTKSLEDLIGKESFLAYTSITEAEIYHGIKDNEEDRVRETLQLFRCLDITQSVGRRAGMYLKKYAKSHGMDVADALIAACSIENKLPLCTFNWKHYPMKDIERFEMER